MSLYRLIGEINVAFKNSWLQGQEITNRVDMIFMSIYGDITPRQTLILLLKKFIWTAKFTTGSQGLSLQLFKTFSSRFLNPHIAAESFKWLPKGAGDDNLKLPLGL